MTLQDSNPKTVVITGCSVGAGYAAASRMAQEGWNVFAAVRTQADADRLEKQIQGSLTAFLCDVRDRDQVLAMAEAVTAIVGERGLDGLVCNAGVGASGPIEFLDRDEMSIPIEVNLYGSIFCAQAFLPLLRLARGRIINVTSGAVLFTMPMMIMTKLCNLIQPTLSFITQRAWLSRVRLISQPIENAKTSSCTRQLSSSDMPGNPQKLFTRLYSTRLLCSDAPITSKMPLKC